MEIRIYENLAEDARTIRQKVFMEEQGFKNEIDDIDDIATHIVMYDDNRPVATCRIFAGKDSGQYILGRLAVIKEYRGRNIGTQMLNEAEKVVLEKKVTSIALHAQCRVKEFYAHSGYIEYGEIGDDEGCPHIWMKKQLG